MEGGEDELLAAGLGHGILGELECLGPELSRALSYTVLTNSVPEISLMVSQLASLCPASSVPAGTVVYRLKRMG